ncbi:unnamed protein product [Caenorhabditis auriculariae]|uniref:Secreted protein n=1 Tax=Caenorhabditis auriculariae TaxID=2777116 RepID=A0A8S1HSM6_9PELO|nr:unnamed protein product [Caenorhabditis auriculariae]
MLRVEFVVVALIVATVFATSLRRSDSEIFWPTGFPPQNVYGLCGRGCPEGLVCRSVSNEPQWNGCSVTSACDIYRLRCVPVDNF